MTALTLSRHAIDQPQKVVAALTGILAKAEKHANAASLPDAKLVDDMKPLSFQIHCVSDNISKGLARTMNTEPAALRLDELKTIADLQARLKWTSEALEKADADVINKSEDQTVTLGLGPGKSGQMSALNYILDYSAPNVYFHFNMAYAILRKEGVEVGKMDYLGPFGKESLTML